MSYIDGTLTVNPADLTITADDKNKIYGSVNPELTASFTGLVADDQASDYSPTLVTTSGVNTGVGGYDISVSGVVDPNYNISYVDGTITINPAGLTITADDKNKIYGSANPELTATFTGLVADDQASDYSPALATAAGVNSGIGGYDISVSGVVDPNYNISYTNGTLTVLNKSNSASESFETLVEVVIDTVIDNIQDENNNGNNTNNGNYETGNINNLGSLLGQINQDNLTTEQLTQDAQEIINFLNNTNLDLVMFELDNQPGVNSIIGDNAFIQLIIQTVATNDNLIGNEDLCNNCMVEAVSTFNKNFEAFMAGNLSEVEVTQLTQDAIIKILKDNNRI